MTELIRDTPFGHIVRFVSKGKYLQYEEEKNPELWKQYVNEEKSGYVAHHGHTGPHSDDSDTENDRPAYGLGGVRTREDGTTEPVKLDAEGHLPGPEKEKELGSNGADSDESEDLKGDKDKTNGSGQTLDRERSRYNEASGVKIDPEKGRDVNIIDWWGPNDPENPQNWSEGKKFFVTFEICLLTFSVYIGSAIYSAGLQDVQMQFGVSQVVAELGLTLFVIGYGVGPMIWSPMSEIPQIGRNPIYISTLFVFVFLQFPVIYSVNIGMLLAFRFLTGFIGSPCLATGGASLADMYSPSKRAYAIAIWGIAAVCGPVMGPLVGGFAAQHKGWTWTIWELLWLSGFTLILLFFFFPETSANNILYRRTRRLRKLTGNNKLKCEPELAGENMTGKDIVMMVLVRPITLNFMEPMVFLLNLYIALVYLLLYGWFESFPLVFIEIYGFNLSEEGLSFLGILIGAFIVIPPFFWYLKKFQEPKFNEKGEIKPEIRLQPAFVGGFCIAICLFWFGWSAGRSPWIVPIIGSAWFTIGAFLLFNSVLNYLPDAYPEVAASVLAGNDFMRSSFGAAFPLFATQMYERLGVDWASSLLAFLALLFVPIPFILYRYGATLRVNHSKYARKDI